MIHTIDAFPGPEIQLEGRRFLYFGGTAYLGLQTDPQFQDILIGHIRKYGTNYGASRNSNIQISVYKRAEAHLSQLVGSESCLTLSSGYLAGQLVRQYFGVANYSLFEAPNLHPALQLPNSSTFSSYSLLRAALHHHLDSNENNTPVLFLDSIDFSGCNYPYFRELATLPLEKMILVVDDSHGIGVVGENGRGTYGILSKLGAKEIIVCCSLGKGFGIQAGAIFGPENRLEHIGSTAFFGGAAPATPANLATLLDARELLSQKRKRLRKNMAQFKELTSHLSLFTTMEGHPTYSFSNAALIHFLEGNGILVTNFPYPRKDSPIMGRIVLSAHHRSAHLRQLAHHIDQFTAST
jgi:7-keto-8-aminopelargonate synthetase-like enzyme